MERDEIIKSLQGLFEGKKKDDGYVVETKQADGNNYLSLVANEQEEQQIKTHPDFETFINLLKYQNTRDLNNVALLLTKNKKKIFVEFSDEKREQFLTGMRNVNQRLLGANSSNLVLVECVIVDWANKALEIK